MPLAEQRHAQRCRNASVVGRKVAWRGLMAVSVAGITGAAAAVANAVRHATGKRVLDLPITLDKLL